MGGSSSTPAGPAELLMTGSVGPETLRLLLGRLGTVEIALPAIYADAGGPHVTSSMMRLPDGTFFLLQLQLRGAGGEAAVSIAAHSLLAPPQDAEGAATVAALLERSALLFVVDASSAAAGPASEKEQLHEMLGSMGGRPPLAVVVALNASQGCNPLPGADGGSLSDGVRERLGVEELKAGGALVHLLEMSSEDFPDHGVMAEAVDWLTTQLHAASS